MNRHSAVWSLQEAKAKFSEVVRLAQTEGPQTVTVHGKEAVVISPAAKKSKRRRRLTGADIVKAFQSCPVPDFKVPERPHNVGFREVDLRAVGCLTQKRLPAPAVDLLIAAVALEHGLKVATRDTELFVGTRVPVLNPWTGERFNGA